MGGRTLTHTQTHDLPTPTAMGMGWPWVRVNPWVSWGFDHIWSLLLILTSARGVFSWFFIHSYHVDKYNMHWGAYISQNTSMIKGATHTHVGKGMHVGCRFHTHTHTHGQNPQTPMWVWHTHDFP